MPPVGEHTGGHARAGRVAILVSVPRRGQAGSVPRCRKVERAVRSRVDQERLSAATIAELRFEIQQSTAARDEAQASVQRDLKRQLRRLEGQEDRIVELVADGDLPVEKLKARLRAVGLQRAHLQERLAQTDEELQNGFDSIEVYLDMLSEPGALFGQAEDVVRRQLAEAFFSAIFVGYGRRREGNCKASPSSSSSDRDRVGSAGTV